MSENNSIIKALDKIDAVRAEIYCRTMFNKTNRAEFENKTWNELCEEGIRAFHDLKCDFTSPARATACWIERYDYDMETNTYLCSNCKVEYVGIPRSPVCPKCKALIVEDEAKSKTPEMMLTNCPWEDEE